MHCSRNSGFTLVEILCVVVILGIAAGIIIPQLGTRHDLKVAAAARMVISDLMYAQNLAISRQRNHYVRFAVADQQYTLMSGSPPTAIIHPVNKTPYAMRIGSATRGLDGVSIDSIDFGNPQFTTIGFDELGSPFTYDENDGSITALTAPATITLRSGEITRVISIEPFTGETSVQ